MTYCNRYSVIAITDTIQYSGYNTTPYYGMALYYIVWSYYRMIYCLDIRFLVAMKHIFELLLLLLLFFIRVL